MNTLKLNSKDQCIEEHLVKLLMARTNPSFRGYFKVQKNNKIVNYICMGQNKKKFFQFKNELQSKDCESNLQDETLEI